MPPVLEAPEASYFDTLKPSFRSNLGLLGPAESSLSSFELSSKQILSDSGFLFPMRPLGVIK